MTEDDVYLQSLVIEDEATKLQEVHICVGGPDIGRIKDAVRAAFEATIDQHLSRPEFGGEIHVVVLAEVTPQTPGLWRAMAEMEERLEAVVRVGKLRTASGHPVRVSFNYTERSSS
jgi:hypothetical protein